MFARRAMFALMMSLAAGLFAMIAMLPQRSAPTGSALAQQTQTCGAASPCPTTQAVQTGLVMFHRYGSGVNAEKVSPNGDTSTRVHLIATYKGAEDSPCPCDDLDTILDFTADYTDTTTTWFARDCVWTLFDGTVVNGVGANKCEVPAGLPLGTLSQMVLDPPIMSSHESCTAPPATPPPPQNSTAALAKISMVRKTNQMCSFNDLNSTDFFPVEVNYFARASGTGHRMVTQGAFCANGSAVKVRTGPRRASNAHKHPFECSGSFNALSVPYMWIRYQRQ